MIQIYTDGVLVYDSRLEAYDLQGLKITRGLNKGGTAEIAMPAIHPAYGRFNGYRTVVEIFRDGRLKFRGRALYPIDDIYNTRTVVCEGEYCFFQDAVSRPYLYQTSPAAIFTSVVNDYNSQVEPFKQFKVGTVTVTDPNDYVRLESESAESVQDTLTKLVERCGGYIVFTTDETGARVVHWLESVGETCSQTIEVGENLFSFSRNGANTNLATAIVPYGAKDERTGQRLTIASVNGGRDYIKDDLAVSLRGTITKTVIWDDVTEPENLLKKARQYLDECKLLVTSMELTALDLSYIDRDIDSFDVGDSIRVLSRSNNLDEYFQLVEHTEDLLNPANSNITLGKEVQTLTGLGAAGDYKNKTEIQQSIAGVKIDNAIQTNQAVGDLLPELKSIINQEADAILLSVSRTYATTATVESSIKLLADSMSLKVSGALGSTASITLSVNGAEIAESLDLSKVRQAFAADTSAAVVSAGTITFNSNTLIINSTNLQVTKDGTITATNAELSGSLTTESSYHKSKLTSGRLRFYYNDAELGSFATTYFTGDSSKRGVGMFTETGALFISFNYYNTETEDYSAAYILNFGVNPSGKTERHLFYGTTRFNSAVYCVSPVYFQNSVVFDNEYGVRGYLADKSAHVLMLAVSSANYIRVGHSSYQTRIYGSSINLYNATTAHATITCNDTTITFTNGYGIRLENSSGTAVYALSMTSSNAVMIGADGYQLRLRGSTVVLNSSGATVTSDRRLKNSIEELPDAYGAVIDKLTPVRFKFNDGTSGRYHVGFIAQEVQQALEAAGLTTQDFGGFVDLHGDGEELGLIYTEFVALLLHKIKQQEQRLAALEAVC